MSASRLETLSHRRKRRSESELEGEVGPVAVFVRERRKKLGYTQEELARRTGTSLNFIKSVELGKASVRMDKVNQVLDFFGAVLMPSVEKETKGEQIA